MQQQILERYPSASIRVYTVWLPMLPRDRRSASDTDLMPDPRLTHLWDEGRLVSRWVAERVEEANGFAWDTYLLYGPDAVWEDLPRPLLGAGATVIRSREELGRELSPLLGP